MQKILYLGVLLLLFHPPAEAFNGPDRSTGVPRFDEAVDKALAYLQRVAAKNEQRGGQQTLVAYAMIQCGIPKDDPFVAKAVAAAARRSGGVQYQPVSAYEHIYGAGVDSMLLADIDPVLYLPNLQTIANYVESVQRPDGSWSDRLQQPGDVSMSQYGVLALWACQRARCKVSASAFDRAADFLMRKGNADGGWGYRPGTTVGPGAGASTHNMTMAGGGTLGICRLLLHGPRNPPETEKEKGDAGPGGLRKIDPQTDSDEYGSAFPDFQPHHPSIQLDERVDRAFAWNLDRFQPVSRVEHNLYYYYCLERAAALGELDKVDGEDWFIVYGNGLLNLQAEDGSFNTHSGPVVGTCFALLYYKKSTQKSLDALYGSGQLLPGRGNLFADRKTEEPRELQRLLQDILTSSVDGFDESTIESADEIVRSVQAVDDPETLIGQVDQLTRLMQHSNDKIRRAAAWALGRTGDLKLVPLLLDALRDSSVDVNIEAIQALRFISRKPHGFGETLAPLASLGTDEQIESSSPEQRLELATPWREKALTDWSNWYFSVRAFEDRGGLDELQLAARLQK
jgi:hypothetical protein